MQQTASSVDPDFDGLDYGFANGKYAGESRHLMGWRDLWCAVIAQALVDIGVILPRNASNPKRARGPEYDAALRWLTRNKRDFIEVCGLAGVSPEIISKSVAKFVGMEV